MVPCRTYTKIIPNGIFEAGRASQPQHMGQASKKSLEKNGKEAVLQSAPLSVFTTSTTTNDDNDIHFFAPL